MVMFPPNDRLQSGTEIADDAARPDDNSPHDSKISNDTVARNFEACGDHGRIHAIGHHLSP